MFSAFVYIIDSSVIYDQRLPTLHTALAWSYLPCNIKIMALPVSIVYEFQVPHQNVAAKITRHYSKISTKLESSWTTCTRPFRSHVCMHQSQTKSLGYDICLEIISRWKNNSLLYNISGPKFCVCSCCCCSPCTHCIKWTWFVEEILADGNRLRSTHFRKFPYFK